MMKFNKFTLKVQEALVDLIEIDANKHDELIFEKMRERSKSKYYGDVITLFFFKSFNIIEKRRLLL